MRSQIHKTQENLILNHKSIFRLLGKKKFQKSSFFLKLLDLQCDKKHQIVFFATLDFD